MAIDVAPFDDPLVRQALRLVARPPGASSTVRCSASAPLGQRPVRLRGYWNFADDLPPRDQDLEQAKALLAQAGKEDLEVTLQTSDIVPGFVEAATLFAQQAKDAGVKVNVKKEAANAYFDTSQAVHEDGLRAVVLDVRLARASSTSRRCSRTRSGTRRTSATRPSTS